MGGGPLRKKTTQGSVQTLEMQDAGRRHAAARALRVLFSGGEIYSLGSRCPHMPPHFWVVLYVFLSRMDNGVSGTGILANILAMLSEIGDVG